MSTLNVSTINTATVNGSTGAADATVNGTLNGYVNTPGGTAFRNRIINGAMMIDQRNAGASVTSAANATYFVDRWRSFQNANSKFSAQQNAGAVTPPTGFRNYFGTTSLSAYSVLSTEVAAFGQSVEGYNVADLGWGAAGAASVTLSFWARSSLTGLFAGAVQNVGQTRSYPFTFTISSANTWEYKTVTIPGDTTGTWATDNGVGLYLLFSLGAGSNYQATANAWGAGEKYSVSGAVSVVGTNAATFYITGVQLEKGISATTFEVRPYGTELALCQRYYYRVSNATGVASSNRFGPGYVNTATEALGQVPFPVQMRVYPSGNFSAASDWSFASPANTVAASAITISSTPNIGSVALTVSGYTVGQGGQLRAANNNAWMDFSAEL